MKNSSTTARSDKIILIIAAVILLTAAGSAFARGFFETRIHTLLPRLCDGVVERTGETYERFIAKHYSGVQASHQIAGIYRAQKAACDGNTTVPFINTRDL